MTTLIIFMFVFLIIIVVGILNEKFIHIPNDIALVLFSTVVGIALILLSNFVPLTVFDTAIEAYSSFDFAEFLFHGVHCFMLFAGASKLHFSKLVSNAKSVGLLATLTTVIFAVGFGLLFKGVTFLLNIEINIWVCIMLGCLLSPTAPLAVTGILDKMGIAKNVTSIMEGESLFNEGVGVALFVFVEGIVGATHSHTENFMAAIIIELFGAIVIALGLSFMTFWLLRMTRDPIKHIIISLLNVSCAYVICESFGFSGAVASVVCGLFYAYSMEKIRRVRKITDSKDLYNDFWYVVDDLINNVLYVLIGLSIITITFDLKSVWLSGAAILIAIIARFIGVLVSSLAVGKRNLPMGYNTCEYTTLMTWAGLRGGLSLALVMSTKHMFAGVPIIYTEILDVTYIVILFTVIVQGLTSANVYRLVEKHKINRFHKKDGLTI